MSLVAFNCKRKITPSLIIINGTLKRVNELLNANIHLEERIKDKTKKLEKFNQKLKNEIEKELLKSRQKDKCFVSTI